MATRRLTILWVAAWVALSTQASDAQTPSTEDQVATCEAILHGRPESSECARIFPKKGRCCIQYDAERLAKICEKMPTVAGALNCFLEINEAGFRKSDLLPESQPGLADQYAKQWKINSLRICSEEKSAKSAIACANLQKSGIRTVFEQKNTAIKGSAVIADPIVSFCRKAFGDYWEGVEQCVRDQRAAKRRMGL